MEMLNWTLENHGETLLLVAVDPRAAATPGAWPCRVVGTFAPPKNCAQPVENRISQLLARVGVPGNLLGCTYLRTALSLLLEEPALSRGMNRRLYPRIALKHGATAPGVERAIRHAIAQAFARGSGEYRAALGRLASFVGEKPTNAEFLAQMTEHLRLGA